MTSRLFQRVREQLGLAYSVFSFQSFYARGGHVGAYLGTRPDAYATPELKQYVKDFPPAAVARDQLEFATAELSTYQTGRVRKLLDDAIQSVLTGSKSPAEALGGAQKKADRLLKRYR